MYKGKKEICEAFKIKFNKKTYFKDKFWVLN
jgi:hypothetical protein